MPIAAAIASRTERIRIGTSVVLLPFHHPVRLAEDGATVDVISGGRFELGVAVGYKIEEFEGFAISTAERAGRTNEGLEIIRRLWEGETLTFKGRYYDVNHVKLTPEPDPTAQATALGRRLYPPGVRRAAKYGDGFICTGPMDAYYELYKAEMMKLGKPTDDLNLAGGFMWLIPATDPDKSWNEAAEHVIYQLNAYAEWMETAGMSLVDPEAKARWLSSHNERLPRIATRPTCVS